MSLMSSTATRCCNSCGNICPFGFSDLSTTTLSLPSKRPLSISKNRKIPKSLPKTLFSCTLSQDFSHPLSLLRHNSATHRLSDVPKPIKQGIHQLIVYWFVYLYVSARTCLSATCLFL